MKYHSVGFGGFSSNSIEGLEEMRKELEIIFWKPNASFKAQSETAGNL